jgi:hypothetical protein
MKMKKSRIRKRRPSARRKVRIFLRKRRETADMDNGAPALTPWLRIVPNGIGDDPSAEVPRGLLTLRNGRRQPRDLDMYIPEGSKRNG